jgi:tetratricopeptide (TPR) repeat protein
MKRFCGIVGLIVLALTGINASAVGQPLMELKDFFDIIGKSSVIYDYQMITKPVAPPSVYDKLNFNHHKLVDSAGVRSVRPFQISFSALEHVELGWQAYMADEPETAIGIFKEVLDSFPEYTPAMSRIGDVLKGEERLDEAIHWYRKALAKNPIDYIAAWSLARTYEEAGKPDSAMVMLLHAWVLNRNNQHIQRELETVIEASGKQMKNWQFVPQYELDYQQDKVLLKYHEAWLGYAICQAVWDFEPGFAEQRNINGDVALFRERECLACLVSTMNAGKNDASTEPALNGFATALRNKMAFEFILFEILLPQNPDMAYILGPERTERLVEYLKITRL